MAFHATMFERQIPGVFVETAILACDGVGGSCLELEPGRFFLGIFSGLINKLAAALASAELLCIAPDWAGKPGSDLGRVISRSIEADAEFRALAWLITRHEFVHLRFGHVGWLNSCVVHDENGSRIVGVTPLDRQTLEMDADSNATFDVAGDFLGLERISPTQFTLTEHGPYARERLLTRARVLGAAIYTHFRILEEESRVRWLPGMEQTNSRHPPTLVRFAITQSSVGTLALGLKPPQPGLVDDVLNSFIHGAVDRERFISATRGEEPVYSILAASCSKAVWRYQGHLIEHWRGLRRKLEPFVVGGFNLAPAQDWPDPPDDFCDP
ncbi:hypothetical protein SAMN05192571_101154 [Pleomorphomonas diazotrophica]|nr:hypothetical protein SAMN05192571_101154 [Pleomorphomonas diazotrophica]